MMIPCGKILYSKLLKIDVLGQLPGAPIEAPPELSKDEIRRLVGFASVLSLSTEKPDRAKSYEIATRLIELYGEQNKTLLVAADIILSRLGNFPGRTLLRKRYSATPNEAPVAPPWLSLERTAREIENSLPTEGSQAQLTDFQFELFHALDESKSVSVSAPTSAGKSFVMGIDLVRRLTKGTPACIIYLVPTRALIHEVSFKLREKLREYDIKSIPIRTAPFPIEIEEAPQGAVYVLTQERLMSLLHSRNGTVWITTLIVDEAQGVQDDARGIVLQSSIEAVLKRFPEVEVHFACPLVKNPEYLLDLFGRGTAGKSIIETLSPVSQNLILVSEVSRQPTKVRCELLLERERFDLGVINIGFRFRDSAIQQRALFAIAVTRDDEATILYANDPSDTEDLASSLIDQLTENERPDQEIKKFIEFLKSEIHADYPLITCLPYGVAFHYGDMPAIVRSKVEKLFKNGKLKYVCCTSTLLQGVNLPARHIIIENPKRGTGSNMLRRDFLNLAGRAGRLLHEFHGNVWCLRPGSWDCFDGEPLQSICSAMHEAMEDGGIVIQRLLADQVRKEEVDFAEAALGKVYCDFVMSGDDLLGSIYKTKDNELALAQTIDQCQGLKITLPLEVIDFNRAIRPDRLQLLYDYLKDQTNLDGFIPIKPGMPNANTRMQKIIKILEENLGNTHNSSYLYYTWLATQWIYNIPLKFIIHDRIEDKRKKGDTSPTSTLIRYLLKDLEKIVRFKLVKYYIAYTSILSFICMERGDTATAESIEPFHVYLECGATDRNALNLIAIGLSRVTALAVFNKISFPQDSSPEDCFSKLAGLNLDHLNIPHLCIEEIRDLIGK